MKKRNKKHIKNTILWTIFTVAIALLCISGDMIFIYPVFTIVADILAVVYIYIFGCINYNRIMEMQNNF